MNLNAIILCFLAIQEVYTETTCYSTGLTDDKYDEIKSVQILDIFHVSNMLNNFEIICLHARNNSFNEDQSIVIFNETMNVVRMKSNVSLSGIVTTFNFIIPEYLFYHDPLDGIFFFPKWTFEIYVASKFSPITRGTIHWLSQKISATFSLPSPNYVSNEIKGRSLSDNDIMFDLYIDENAGITLHLHFLDTQFGTSTLATDNAVIKSLINFVVTAKSIIVLANAGTIFNIVYEHSKETYVIYQLSSSTLFRNLSYSIGTWFGLHEPSKSDIVIIYPIGNHTHFFFIEYPFQNIKTFKYEIPMVERDPVHSVYDFERKHFIILLKNRIANGTSTIYSIYVLNRAGLPQCTPFYMRSDNKTLEISYQRKTGEHIIHAEEQWTSTDGGCMFLRSKQFEYASISYVRNDQLKLSVKDAPNLKSLKATMTSYYYGFLDSTLYFDAASSAYFTKFYLNRYLPVSDSAMTFSSFEIRRTVQNKFYLLTLDKGIWPVDLINSTIQCLPFGMLCIVREFINEMTVKGECGIDGLKKDFDVVTCSKYLWFITEKFNAIKKNISVNIINESTLSTSYFNQSEFIYFTGIQCSGYLLISNNSTSVLHYRATNGMCEPDIQNINIETRYNSIFKLLFTKSEHCPFSISILGTPDQLIYLDLLEEIKINVTLKIDETFFVPENVLQKDLIKLFTTNSKSVDIRLKYFHYNYEQILKIKIKQKQIGKLSDITSLRISCSIEHNHCHNLIHTLKIAGSCSKEKYLVFKYPVNFTVDQFLNDIVYDSEDNNRLYELPLNYQPPSFKGVAIPWTIHVYNADPGKELYHKRYMSTQPMHVYKQCHEKKHRVACNCSRVMKTSFRVSDSDCTEKVYRMFYSEKLTPKVYLKHSGIISKLTAPYYLVELNSREDFFLTDTKDNDDKTMVPTSYISFKGSGLYHFRIELVEKRVSFCKLETEFIIYIDGAPLGHPAEDLVRAGTSMLFGTVLLVVFLYKYYRNAD